MPYTKEEINLLFDEYQNGDELSGHKIIESFIPFAKQIAIKFASKYKSVGYPDLFQEAQLVLCKILPKYNKKFNFSTLAHKSITNRLKDVVLLSSYNLVRGEHIPLSKLSKMIKEKQKISMHRNSICTKSKFTVEDNEELSSILEDVLSILSSSDKSFIIDYFYKTPRDIMCKKYNIDKALLYKKVKQILANLRMVNV